MEQLNRIELRGVVGNVKLQDLGDRKFARITLATNHAYMGKDGTAVIDTSWHNIVAREGKYITALENIKKGDKLYVLGRMRYQKYTGADKVERMAADVVATRIVMIEDSEPLQYEM